MKVLHIGLMLSTCLVFSSCDSKDSGAPDSSQVAVEVEGGTSASGSTSGGTSTGGTTTGGTSTGGQTTSCNPIGSCAGDPNAFKAYSYSDRAFPDDNPFNVNISQAAVDPMSDVYITNIGKTGTLHAAFGTVWAGDKLGHPINIVHANQPKVPMSFLYNTSSDPGPYPIPPDALIQDRQDSTGDRHVIVVDVDNGMLYELYRGFPNGAGWKADAGAVWDMKTNKRRPNYWTSADAAGLPMFPALVRYSEVVEQGEIRHALRVTVNKTRKGFVFPATHQASTVTDLSIIPMGARLRLKASYDISKFSKHVQVILKAMKTYGLFVADNGVSWQFSGDHDMRWDDQELSQLRQVPGSAFEVIKMPPVQDTPW
jgi:hypothetical protein